ncbi:MAG TPA: inorganic phosphate transporter [Candidatus Aerophobetes bacterium]|nr:inorganic phosphate transporter [Candidatus Aerophobetes bacterium]
MSFILASGIVTVVLIYAFINGFHDGGNVVATMISSQTLRPRYAFAIGAVSEFIGAFFLGGAVARTISTGIVNPHLISIWSLFAALAGAIFWNIITWWWGFPSSSSHALIGGLVGAALIDSFLMSQGVWQLIYWRNLIWILIVLFTSPLIGLCLGYLLTKLIFLLGGALSPKANRTFKNLQILSSFFIGISHGSNDAPKAMGIIVMALIILGIYRPQEGFILPLWIVLICAVSFSFGVFRASRRLIRTLGTELYKIRHVHGFLSQSSSALIVVLSSLTGFPVSTTQIVNSSVIGVGAGHRAKAIRWKVARDIFLSWLFTIPGAGAIAVLLYLLVYWLA